MKAFLKSMTRSQKDLSKTSSSKELDTSSSQSIPKFSSHPPVFVSTLYPSILSSQSELLNRTIKEWKEEEEECDEPQLSNLNIPHISKPDFAHFQILKYIKPNSEKIVVIFGNTEECISYNRSILFIKTLSN